MKATALRSALYRGTVTHARLGDPSHSFRYRVSMPLLYLDEIDRVCAANRGWSAGGRAPVEFRRSDFLTSDGPLVPLSDAVEAVVEASGRPRPRGPIAMLANLRGFGWQFNPIALYYCFDPNGDDVETLAMEVTNTPWKERHTYVIGAPGRHEMTKALHVSPFMTMDHTYVVTYDAPRQGTGSRLRLSMANYSDGVRRFSATLDLVRHELTADEAARYARSATAARVSAAIYYQALRLRAKHVRFVPHPDRARPSNKEHVDEPV